MAAKNQVQQVRAALKQARDDLSKTTIYAGDMSPSRRLRSPLARRAISEPPLLTTCSDSQLRPSRRHLAHLRLISR